MDDGDWTDGAQSIGMYLNGHGIAGLDSRGGPIVDDHILLYFNASADPVGLTLPPEEYAAAWDVAIDTSGAERTDKPFEAGAELPLEGRSVLVLREHQAVAEEPETSVAASVAAQAQAGRTG